MKELSVRMFEIDSSLSREGANVNHNLAGMFKLYARLTPDKLKRVLERFEPELWLERLETVRKEIEAVCPGLPDQIEKAIHDLAKYKEA